ncbi:beta-galactosidase [Paenibacillus sp. MDMC362]|uniref:beta-galactosidase n=1 Tax=Paenibacillus sp. MDMC362 TaxID=2977365 RepID=UPI0015EC6975
MEKLASHYANHPAVIDWQIDNEFGLNECHCEQCNIRFREMAVEEVRYIGSLEFGLGHGCLERRI